MQTIREQITRLLGEALGANVTLLPNQQSLDDYVDKILTRAELLTWHEEGKLVGLIAFYCNDPKSSLAFISMIVVAESHQRLKLATILLQATIANMKARSFKVCRLRVHVDNLSAISLYKKLGFKKVRLEDDTAVMELVL